MASTPALARPAATVVLLRDGPGGLEAYLQRRPLGLGFAGGLWVFPGGAVDAGDRHAAIDRRWAGPGPVEWAARLDLPVPHARGMVAAACRETFEEAGVLLADRPSSAEALDAARQDLLAGTRDLAQVLDLLDVRLATDCLRYWAWWVTPEAEPRRYDARFFVAALPTLGAAAAHAPEAERERWLPVAAAAADWSLPMLPPTRLVLRSLAPLPAVEAVLRAGEHRTVERALPRLEGDVLVLPWGERYPVPLPADGDQ